MWAVHEVLDWAWSEARLASPHISHLFGDAETEFRAVTDMRARKQNRARSQTGAACDRPGATPV
jgi:hypothetical protein